MNAVATPASPFKGLAPFGDSDLDALLFFGRANETEVIAANLQASRLTVLYGPSGVGKSSVLRAGVAQRLRREAGVAVVFVDSWAGDPVDAVSAALGAHDPSLADALADAAKRADGDVYLVLDQFEEYFLYHPDDDRLATELAEVVARRGLRANVLIGIRDDALARLDAFRRPIPTLLANRLRLDPLDREAGRAAITGPLQRWNRLTGESVEMEPQLVEAVLDEVTSGRVELRRAGLGAIGAQPAQERIEAPYLQLVVERLWDAERDTGSQRLRLATLTGLGGAARIVDDHLERAMDSLTPSEKEAAAAMYNHLVTPSGTKIAHGISDLAGYASVDEEEAASVLRKLARERILRASSDNGAATARYEIFHDVLASAVLDWRARHEEKRRLRRAHDQQRRARLVATAALVGLVVVAAIAVFALVERSHARAQARRAHARELVADADSQLDTDPAAAVRLALAAARIEAGPREEDVLRTALVHDRQRAVLRATGPVTVAAYDRSGAQLVTGSRDGNARIYRRGSTRPLHVLDQGAPVTVVSFSPDGRFVLTGGRDGTARLWATSTGSRVRSFDAGGSVSSAVFGRRGVVMTAATNGTLRLWRTHSGKLLAAIRTHTGRPLVSATLDPTGRLVATVSRDRFARIYSFASARLVHVLPQKGFVGSAVFSPDGKFVLTAGNEGEARLWLLDTGQLVRRFAGPRKPLNQAVFSHDETLVAAASADGTARVWRIATGAQRAVLIGHGAAVVSVAFSPDDATLVTASADGTARVWTADAGRPIAVLAGHSGPVVGAAYSPDGQAILTASDDGTARIWDPNTDPVVGPVHAVTARSVNDLAFSPDGRRFVTAGIRVAAWVTAPTHPLWSAAVTSPAIGVAYSHDGRRIVTVHADGKVRTWRAEDGAPARTSVGRSPAVAAAFTPDGRIVVAERSAVDIWNGARLEDKLRQRAPVTDVAVSPDGKLIAVASSDGVGRIERLADGAVLHTLTGHRLALTAIAFSPDGSRVVTASDDNTARVWDAASGRKLVSETNSFGPVVDAAFSPDGRWIVTAGPVTAPLASASSGKRLFYLRGPTRRVTSVAFGGPGGRLVLIAARDGTVRRYECVVCGDINALERLAERRLAAGG